jgi:hypothetical protein
MKLASLGLALVFASSLASAASPKQRCIEAAEDGQQLRSEGKLQDAAEKFTVCAAEECPKLLQKDCAQWLGEVQSTKPTVTVRVEDEDGREVHDAHITLDDVEWIPGENGKSRPVSIGVHRFVWVREAKAAVEQRVELHDGETGRLIVLRAPPRPKPPPPKPASRSISPWVWVGYGLGVGAVAGGSGFYAVGLGQRSTLEGLCGKSHTCLDSDINASRGNLILGDVLVGVGIVAIATSTYFLVRALTRGPAIADLDVAAGPAGGGGTVLGLGFGPSRSTGSREARPSGRSYSRAPE